jgi:DNA-binding PadR family transcriptional regulator
LKTPLSDCDWYNQKRRKPILQIKILHIIANRGRLAISEARSFLPKKHFHKEIWESFKILEDKGLIRNTGKRNPGPGQLLSKGRPRKYYTLTEYGLAALIKEGLDPSKFWTALISYSSGESKHDKRLEGIEEIFDLYLKQYLSYSTGFEYNVILQLDYFNIMCEHWIKNNTSTKGPITLEQKILEILALAGSPDGMTVQEISAKGNEDQERVRKVLQLYSSIPSYESRLPPFKAVYLELDLEYTIQRNIIMVQISNKMEKYSLSLFGILLILTLVRNRNKDRQNLCLQETFNIIATNYKNKLPLIFGQWDTLKDILKVFSVYNFDVIIDRHSRSSFLQNRSSFLQKSAVMNGNKEYYETIRDITMYNREKMMNLYHAGIDTLKRLRSNMEDKENNNQYWENPKTIAIYRKLIEIGVSLGYHLNSITLAGLSTDSKHDLSYVNNEEDIPSTRVLERSFEYEITFLYYLNLNSDIYSQYLSLMAKAHLLSEKTREECETMQRDEYSLVPQNSNILPKSLKERLIAILRRNRQVKEWFSNCILNCIQFRKATDEVMSAFYRDIN